MVPLKLIEEERIIDAIKSNLTMLGVVLPSNQTSRKDTEKVVYLSSAITTGKRLYDYLSKHKIKDPSKVSHETLFGTIMNQNIAESIVASSKIRGLGYPYVIVPGYFIANGWTQQHYYDLWDKVVNDYSDIVFMNAGWEFSSGCVTELYLGLKYNKDLRDVEMNPFNLDEGLKKIRSAIVKLEKRGFKPEKLCDAYRKTELLLSKRPTFI